MRFCRGRWAGGTWVVDCGRSRSGALARGSGEGPETGDDSFSAARMPEWAVALVVAGARLAGAHRFAGVEGQWMSWNAGAEDGFLLAEIPAVLEVVDGLSEEERSALERQTGGPILLGAGFDGPSAKILFEGVCKLQTTME